jgi:hypothetical protein
MRGKCPFNNFEPCDDDCMLNTSIIEYGESCGESCALNRISTSLTSIFEMMKRNREEE